ncbi:MAG: hypothetical protein NT007_09670 [Candidatus Kapabacteria bacterium]|nr:hypothetical protein [Candidatus Kapabacteria bacterium]
MNGSKDINTLCGLEGVNVADQILSLNEKLKRVGVPYYMVGKINSAKSKRRKDGRPVYETSWRKRSDSLSAELNNKFPNASYSSTKSVEKRLKADYGIKLADLIRPSTTDSAIERAKAFVENKKDEALAKEAKKTIKADHPKEGKKTQAELAKERETARKTKAAEKKAKKAPKVEAKPEPKVEVKHEEKPKPIHKPAEKKVEHKPEPKPEPKREESKPTGIDPATQAILDALNDVKNDVKNY